jgi:hypothetical protein
VSRATVRSNTLRPIVRNIFFALLAANILFFAWALLVDRSRDSVVAATLPAVPTLELASLPPAPAAPGPALHCRSLGPFVDAAAAGGNADVLRTHGLQSRLRTSQSSVPDGYLVYVENIKDAAARRRVIAALNTAGLHDAEVAPEEADRVSVGLFSDQRRAVHRAEQVQELGFKPAMTAHQRSIVTTWLDIDLGPDDPDPTPVQAAAPPPKTLPADVVRVIDCPAQPAAGS